MINRFRLRREVRVLIPAGTFFVPFDWPSTTPDVVTRMAGMVVEADGHDAATERALEILDVLQGVASTNRRADRRRPKR